MKKEHDLGYWNVEGVCVQLSNRNFVGGGAASKNAISQKALVPWSRKSPRLRWALTQTRCLDAVGPCRLHDPCHLEGTFAETTELTGSRRVLSPVWSGWSNKPIYHYGNPCRFGEDIYICNIRRYGMNVFLIQETKNSLIQSKCQKWA